MKIMKIKSLKPLNLKAPLLLLSLSLITPTLTLGAGFSMMSVSLPIAGAAIVGSISGVGALHSGTLVKLNMMYVSPSENANLEITKRLQNINITNKRIGYLIAQINFTNSKITTLKNSK